MRDYDPIAEQAFFALFQDFYDLERDVGKQHDPANYSLSRMIPLAEAAGHPERGLRIIHVAGTKGKGSTCHYLAALLRSAGYRTGMFTSPHLCTVRERFEVDGALLPLTTLTKHATELLSEIRRRQLHPSLFEIFAVLALKMFAAAKVDYVILETGIGGRLDATNYISEPVCTVITPVSYDHVDLLGNNITAIATEKAGILKAGVPLVLAKQPYRGAEKAIGERAAQLNCPLRRPRPNQGVDFLPGHYPFFLRDNFAVAWAALRVLGINPVRDSFQLPILRARCEVVSQHPFAILDAAHNADSAGKLVQSLISLYPGVSWNVVLGVVKGKDIRGIVTSLLRLPAASFILTNPSTGKGTALPELTAVAEELHLPVIATIPELNSLTQLPQDRPLLFTGSFFTALIGEKLFHP